jgi:sporulation protein YlmC with PRC-barrel domain
MSLKTGVGVAALFAVIGFSPQVMSQTPPAQRDAAPAARPNTDVKREPAPVTGQILMQDANTILARDLIGQTVYDPDNAKIGSISDLILSKDAKSAEGFVIGVGGFLGIGEKSVALKLDRLKMTPEQDGSLKLVMDIKKDELSNAPTFKSKKEQEQEQQAERSRSQPPAQPGAPSRPKTN